MARPTTYDPAYCEQVLELGKEGASKAEMAFALGCARSTFALWEETHPEFSEAVKTAVGFSQGWWESQGRKSVFGATPNFNATAFIFNMKNRFPADWRDKQEVEQSGEVGVTFKTVYETK
ncbi:MAG: hypothetical protein RLW68_00860 [Devosia marina]|uniref:hypothetical protein n=1 Tax=Devosia marina TaxID=2683198 RepID=UPI0032EFA9D7